MISSMMMRSWIGASLLALTPPTAASLFAESSQVVDDSRAYFDDVIAAYRELNSYADQGVFTVIVNRGNDQQVQEWPVRFALERPGKIAIVAGAARIVSDGTTILTVIDPTRSYLLDPAPEHLTPATISEGPVGAMLLGGPGGLPASILLQLLFGEQPASAILAGGARLEVAPETEIDGTTMKTIRLDLGAGPDYLLHMDPRTKLVRSMTVDAPEEEPDERSAPERNFVTIEMRWSSGMIRTDPLDEETFSVSPPGAYQEVPPLSRNNPE